MQPRIKDKLMPHKIAARHIRYYLTCASICRNSESRVDELSNTTSACWHLLASGIWALMRALARSQLKPSRCIRRCNCTSGEQYTTQISVHKSVMLASNSSGTTNTKVNVSVWALQPGLFSTILGSSSRSHSKNSVLEFLYLSHMCFAIPDLIQ